MTHMTLHSCAVTQHRERPLAGSGNLYPNKGAAWHLRLSFCVDRHFPHQRITWYHTFHGHLLYGDQVDLSASRALEAHERLFA